MLDSSNEMREIDSGELIAGTTRLRLLILFNFSRTQRDARRRNIGHCTIWDEMLFGGFIS